MNQTDDKEKVRIPGTSKHLTLKGEDLTQFKVLEYLRTHYPQALVYGNAGANVGTNFYQANRMKAIGGMAGWPDLTIVTSGGEFVDPDGSRRTSGVLFLELKHRYAESPWTKDGRLKKNEKLALQSSVHQNINALGQLALFVHGFKEAALVVAQFFSGHLHLQRYDDNDGQALQYAYRLKPS